MESSTPKCPPEITDTIIDFLHLGEPNGDEYFDNRAALQNCSLVCREWLPSTRYHLFSVVYIGSPDDLCNFAYVLSTNPSLGQYVREMTLSHFSFRDPSISDALSNTLIHLFNVRSLGFEVMNLYTSDLFDSLKAVQELRSVRKLTMSSAKNCSTREFLELLAIFPLLETLDIGVADIWTNEEDEVGGQSFTTESSVPHLREFSVDVIREQTVSDLFACVRSSPVFRNIESFTTTCEFTKSVKEVGSFLKAIGPLGFLKHFHLNLSEEIFNELSIDEFCDDLSLHSCASSLQSFKLMIYIDVYKTQSFAFNAVCALLLSAFPSPNTLRTFTIGFRNARLMRDQVLYFNTIEALPWNELDEALQRFKELKEVAVMSARGFRRPEVSNGLFSEDSVVAGPENATRKPREVVMEKLRDVSRGTLLRFY